MNKTSLLLLLLLFIAPALAMSQTRVIKGKISDEDGAPLSAVNILVKGSAQGTQTKPDGTFSITVPGTGKITLILSYTGYKTIQILASETTPVDMKLEKDAVVLDEVVVGYQVVKRRDLTASVSSVGAKQLKDIPLNSAEEALAGRLAGVQVTGSEGSPNAQVLIRVRGGGSITQDNSPLYVVDGIPQDNALSTLSLQDIESVDALKDAAATAIYGARGANGVIIITTKGGKNTNGKTSITYNGYVGVSKLAKELPVLSPYDYNFYQYERAVQGNDTATLNQQYPNGITSVKQTQSLPAVDWQDVMLGRNAIQQNHNISITGGTEQTQYNLSVTDNKTEGIMLNSDYDRKLVNFRFDHKANDRVKIGFDVRYNNTTVNGAGTSNPGSSSLNFLRQIIRYRPDLTGNQTQNSFDPAYYGTTAGNSLNLVNPILLNNAQYRQNNEAVTNITAYFNYTITKFLSFRSTFGYVYDNQRNNSFDDTLTSNSKLNGAALPIASINTLTKATIDNSNVFTFTMANTSGNFRRHNDLDGVIGQEIYQTNEKDYYIETRYFPVGISAKSALGNMNLGSPPNTTLVEPKPTSQEIPVTQASFFGRVNYAYDHKYLVSAAFRADGSSLFGPPNKWGYFPSISAAWRISREKFMSNINWLDDLKFRGAYGQAGNNRITPFLYLTQFNSNSNYGLNDVLVTGYVPSALTNSKLKWETTISRNLGIDASMFHNKLNLSVDVYSNKTKDLLVNNAVPSTSGYTVQLQNIGSTTNQGVEVQLSGTILQKRKLNWTGTFNISFNQNKVTSLGPDQNLILFNSGWAGNSNPADFLVQVGQPVGTMWGLVNDGFYTVNDFNYNTATRTYTLKPGVANDASILSITPQPGALKFKDLNGDTVITDKDRKIIGNAQPKFFGGFGQQVSYGNWDLSVFINFQYGNKVYNYNKLEFESGYTPGANLLGEMAGRWKTIDANGVVYQQVKNGAVIGASPDSLTALNKGATIWQPLVAGSGSSFLPQSAVVEDASFIRINNITLGYSLPPSIIRKIKITKLRVYVTANNVATITGYSGYDPEVNTRRGTPVTPGVDYSAYPRSRTYYAGINLTF